MRKRTLGVVLLAGLAISGGGAFTASNTLPTTTTAGYGAAAVTGAVITDIAYNTGSDPAQLASIVFTSSDNLTGKTATMTLRTSGGALVGPVYTCELAYTAEATVPLTGILAGDDFTTITCDTTEDIADFASVGLTVVDA